jgi:hypothetical protein
MGNGSSSGNNNCNGGNCDKTYIGYGGAVCTKQDILNGTNASNSLNDTSGWGNQVSAGISGYRGAKWQCAAEHITYTSDSHGSGPRMGEYEHTRNKD